MSRYRLAEMPIEVQGPPRPPPGKVILSDDDRVKSYIFGSYDAEVSEGDDPGVDVDGYMYRDVDVPKVRAISGNR